jgi:hypothetical protein
MYQDRLTRNDRGCFPPAPRPGPGTDPDARGCFPEPPPRGTAAGPRGRGCFPGTAAGLRPPHRARRPRNGGR